MRTGIWCIVLLVGSAYGAAPQSSQPKELAVDLRGGVKMEMVLIPAGDFMMGNSHAVKEEVALCKEYGMELPAWRFDSEYPQHRVRITKPFYLGKYEVTVGQFRRFVDDTGYKTDSEKGNRRGAYGWDAEKKKVEFIERYSWRNTGFEQPEEHPVVNVSWNDAAAFCQWLSRREGKTYRLPTEAQWEYACRAGTTTRYSSGDDPETLIQVGNVADATAKAKSLDWPGAVRARDSYVFTAPVGKFKPNTFGLYDMHGNVWEWCADWYREDRYPNSPIDDPAGPETGVGYVIRGGSWNSGVWDCRLAIRLNVPPAFRSYNLGLRVVRVAEE